MIVTNTKVMPAKIAGNIVVEPGSVPFLYLQECGVYAGNPARLMRLLDKI